jgi:hypothetical protein
MILLILFTKSKTLSMQFTSICRRVCRVLKTYSITQLQDQYGMQKTSRMSTTMNQIIDSWVPVDIQIIHRENKRPPRMFFCQPITELRLETEESPQVSPSLREAPVEGKGTTNPLIARNGHEQIHTPLSFFILTSCVALLFPCYLSKLPVLGLQLIITLIKVNYIPHALT